MTIHLNSKTKEISETVLLPGDPLRAKWIAENFLDSARVTNDVRGMLGFTGLWKGNLVTVQGSGMGMPSLSIYVNELIKKFKVKTLVRVGSAGAMQDFISLRDIVIGMTASSISTPSKSLLKELNFAPCPDFSLLLNAYNAAKRIKTATHIGGIYSSDTFYDERPDLNEQLVRHGNLAVEMETAELYTIAARYGCRALSILTISDHLLTGESLNSQAREQSFKEMVQISLETVFP